MEGYEMKDKLIGIVMIAVVAGIVVLGARNNSSMCCPSHAIASPCESTTCAASCDSADKDEPACGTEACEVSCGVVEKDLSGCETEDCAADCEVEKQKVDCEVSCG